MRQLFGAAASALAALKEQGIDACVIGGLAVARWGEPRFTVDVDLVAMTAVSRDAEAVDALLVKFIPRMPDARAFALAHRVLILESSEGVRLDVSLGALEFERDMVARSTEWSVDGCPSIRTCSAEDLLVLKAFAGREKDWGDVRGIIRRQGAAINRNTVVQRLTPLAEFAERPEALRGLQEMFRDSSAE